MNRRNAEAAVAAFLARRNAHDPPPRTPDDGPASGQPTRFGVHAEGLVARGRIRADIESISPAEYRDLPPADRAAYTDRPVRDAHWRVWLCFEPDGGRR